MEKDWLERTELLIGKQNIDRLTKAHVLVVGMGGVGSYAAEMICRAGIGHMTIVDGDIVDRTNRNRQLPALFSTEGKAKVDIMADRLLDINPNLKLKKIQQFLLPEMLEAVLEEQFDYVVDCIDSITPKLTLIQMCMAKGYPLMSSMGAGGKLDPTQIRISDISKSFNCPMARLVRKRLHKAGIKKGFKAVWSPEEVIEESVKMTDGSNFKKSFYGTISYVPSAFGIVCASGVINGLIETEEKK